MNHETLRAKALAAKDESCWFYAEELCVTDGFFPPGAEYLAAASPDVVLGLLDENQKLREALKRMLKEGCLDPRLLCVLQANQALGETK